MIAEGLACARGGRTVFEGVSFRLAAGGALLVTGPNGAGKSSLLRVLAGLLGAEAGRLERSVDAAFLGHDNALKEQRTVRSELRFWAGLDRRAIDGRRPAVEAALERFELTPLADLPVRLLSSGQKRRVALARTWASGAPLWLLDEPSVGLDAASVARLAGVMAEHRASGGSIVAASHVPIGLDDAAELRL